MQLYPETHVKIFYNQLPAYPLFMMESTIEILCIMHPTCKTIISYIHGDGHNIQILLDFFEELTEHFASKSAFRG
jgi:hypothetical protein